MVVASRVAVGSGGDHLELEGRLLQVVRVAAVADEVVGQLPFVDDNFLCLPDEGVLGWLKLPGDGGLGHGVGRCVLPAMNMFVDSVGSGTFYRKSFSLDPGIVSIFATGFGGRRTPDHSIGDIDDSAQFSSPSFPSTTCPQTANHRWGYWVL